MVDETNSLLELIALELADIRAHQKAQDEFLFSVYEDLCGVVNAAAQESNPNAPKLLSGIAPKCFTKLFEQHRQACRNEIVARIQEVKSKSDFPFFVD